MHNVVWAHEESESYVYRWLRALATQHAFPHWAEHRHFKGSINTLVLGVKAGMETESLNFCISACCIASFVKCIS